MGNAELIDKAKYLLFKYLEKDRAKTVLENFDAALNNGKNIGKEVLHTISSERKIEIESKDKIIIKEIAYYLGL